METSVVKRFLRYIAVDTQSAAEKDVIQALQSSLTWQKSW